MHSFLVRLRNIDLIFSFFPNDLCVRPPFISSTEMKWQSVDGCGISDVLVMAQHRFEAQHLCLPCQPLRLKVCLCPSISSAFSLGLRKRSGLDFTGQCSEWQQTRVREGKKNPLNFCVGIRPRQDMRLLTSVLPAQGEFPSLLSTLRAAGGLLLPNSSAQPILSDLPNHPLPESLHGAAVSVWQGAAKRDLGTEICLMKCVLF